MILAVVIIAFSLVIFASIKADMNILCKKILIMYLIFIGSILCISSLNPVGLYDVSTYTYMLWIINALSFALAFLVLSKLYIKRENAQILRSDIEYKKIFNSKILFAIEIIEMIFLSYYAIKYRIIIKNIEHSQIRIARYTILFDSAFETLFYNYIIGGILAITTIMFVIMLLEKDYKNPTIWVSIINILLYTSIGFGRMTIFSVAMYFILGLILSNKKGLFKKKQLIKYVIFSFLIFILFVGMICIRMYNSNQSLLKNIKIAISNQCKQCFEYFLGGFRMLDNFVNNGFAEFNKHTLGRATLAGIDEVILYFPKGLGFEINSFNNLASDIMSTAHRVGSNTDYFNAFYTCVMNYYLDFGLIGVILFPIMHAALIVYIVKRYLDGKGGEFSKITLYYVIGNLMFSVLKWNYQGGSNVFVLIVLIVIMEIYNKFNCRKEKQYENSLDS